MAAIAGRDIRIKISLDGGTTYTSVTGSTGDNFQIGKTGIVTTDKDDNGVETYISGAVGRWTMGGSVSGVIKDDNILAFMNDHTQFDFDGQVLISGEGTYEGMFGLTNMSVDGPDGDGAATFTLDIVANGKPTYTAA